MSTNCSEFNIAVKNDYEWQLKKFPRTLVKLLWFLDCSMKWYWWKRKWRWRKQGNVVYILFFVCYKSLCYFRDEILRIGKFLASKKLKNEKEKKENLWMISFDVFSGIIFMFPQFKKEMGLGRCRAASILRCSALLPITPRVFFWVILTFSLILKPNIAKEKQVPGINGEGFTVIFHSGNASLVKSFGKINKRGDLFWFDSTFL